MKVLGGTDLYVRRVQRRLWNHGDEDDSEPEEEKHFYFRGFISSALCMSEVDF